MSHQVLALKWRPRNFKQVVGQEHVIRALVNSLDQQRVHHAFLFTGTRGVGKTSFARILAKALNCEEGISSEPCEKCSSCEEINSGRCIDLIEVDAASRTKVEDTREILENVQYAPSKCRYKIYLIDEVHMLSGHSFNALLKTLEEPPEHVKFLLATTDPQKLPVTVLSRCLQFHLKNMLPEQISTHLEKILEQENIHFESSALQQVAKAANGSMRDALSILEQAIAYSGNQVTETEVRAMLGTIETRHIIDVINALAEKDPQAIFNKANQLAELGSDFTMVLEDLLSALHQIAIAQALGESATSQFDQTIRQIAQNISAEDIQLFYQIALIGRRDLALAPSTKTGFEMTMLRMLSFIPADKPAIQTNTQNSQTSSQEVAPRKKSPAEQVAPKTEVGTTQLSEDNPKTTLTVTDLNWIQLLDELKLTGMTKVFASHCSLRNYDGNIMQLLLDSDQEPLLNDSQKQRLQKTISEHLGQPLKLEITINQQQSSPAAKAKQAQNEKQLQAEQHIENDPKVQAIMQRFDAKIAPGSVKPSDTVN